MRVGLDLRGVDDPGRRQALAVEADELGLWAVLTRGDGPGTETLDAAALAGVTDTIHLVCWLVDSDEHPLTLAEEVAVVDHLSARRVGAVVSRAAAATVARFLAGHIVEGVALAPAPAQTSVPVWADGELATVALSGDLDVDRRTIDEHRDRGVTHLIVAWPGNVGADEKAVGVLARHLVTRAATPDFPQIVADLADGLPGRTSGDDGTPS